MTAKLSRDSDWFSLSPREHCHLVKSLMQNCMYIVFTICFQHGDAKHIGISHLTLAAFDRPNPPSDFCEGFLRASSPQRSRLYAATPFDLSYCHAFAAAENH